MNGHICSKTTRSRGNHKHVRTFRLVATTIASKSIRRSRRPSREVTNPRTGLAQTRQLLILVVPKTITSKRTDPRHWPRTMTDPRQWPHHNVLRPWIYVLWLQKKCSVAADHGSVATANVLWPQNIVLWPQNIALWPQK